MLESLPGMHHLAGGQVQLSSAGFTSHTFDDATHAPDSPMPRRSVPLIQKLPSMLSRMPALLPLSETRPTVAVGP